MKAPNYDWRCHSCNETNTAGTFQCSSCGFPAYAPGRKIVAAARNREPTSTSVPAEAKRAPREEIEWLIFLPDILIAAATIVAFPFWLPSLLHEASYLAAIGLTVCVVSGVGLAWWAWRTGSKGFAYAGLFLVLAGAAVAI